MSDHPAPSSPLRTAILETLVAAFLDDPLYRWLYPDPAIRPLALRDHLGFILDLVAGSGHVDSGSQGRAVAVWTDPGATLLPDPSAFLDLLSRWAPARVEAAKAGMSACAAYEPDGAAVLHLLAVRPDQRGRGLATALLEPRLRDLDATGSQAYLTSSNRRNVSLYQRCGFSQLAQVTVPGGGPTMLPMQRDPDGGLHRTETEPWARDR